MVCLCARNGVIAVCERDRKHPEVPCALRMYKTPLPDLKGWIGG